MGPNKLLFGATVPLASDPPSPTLPDSNTSVLVGNSLAKDRTTVRQVKKSL